MAEHQRKKRKNGDEHKAGKKRKREPSSKPSQTDDIVEAKDESATADNIIDPNDEKSVLQDQESSKPPQAERKDVFIVFIGKLTEPPLSI
jgi:hypothetical protein